MQGESMDSWKNRSSLEIQVTNVLAQASSGPDEWVEYSHFSATYLKLYGVPFKAAAHISTEPGASASFIRSLAKKCPDLFVFSKEPSPRSGQPLLKLTPDAWERARQEGGGLSLSEMAAPAGRSPAFNPNRTIHQPRLSANTEMANRTAQQPVQSGEKSPTKSEAPLAPPPIHWIAGVFRDGKRTLADGTVAYELENPVDTDTGAPIAQTVLFTVPYGTELYCRPGEIVTCSDDGHGNVHLSPEIYQPIGFYWSSDFEEIGELKSREVFERYLETHESFPLTFRPEICAQGGGCVCTSHVIIAFRDEDTVRAYCGFEFDFEFGNCVRIGDVRRAAFEFDEHLFNSCMFVFFRGEPLELAGQHVRLLSQWYMTGISLPLFFKNPSYWQTLDTEIPGVLQTGIGDEQPGEALEAFHEWGGPESETEFLRRFAEGVRACGFVYNFRDLVRFHTAVKIAPFTLLGGCPGSGKSSLAALYLLALNGVQSSDRSPVGLLRVNVSPAWAEPADLMGYESGVDGKFHESSSGICTFLRQASRKKTVRHMVCFEEMNLACAEHYFSDFIQLLSLPSGERVLKGYAKAGYVTKAPKAPKDLVIPDWVGFVGTCNFDTTTHEISERFYDRCAYLEITPRVNEQTELEDEPGLRSAVRTPVMDPDKMAVALVDCATYCQWQAYAEDLPEEINKQFIVMERMLRPLGLIVSPRIRERVAAYLCSRPPMPGTPEESSPLLRWQHALDEAIAQFILPRYRPDPMHSQAHSAVRKRLEEVAEMYPYTKALWDNLEKRYPSPEF